MSRLADAIIEDRHDGDTVLLQVYGEYLLNGGTPEDFGKLTHDDVQVMHTVGTALRIKHHKTIIEAIAKMLGAVEQ